MQKLIAGVLSLALVLNLGGGIRKNESAGRHKSTRAGRQTVAVAGTLQPHPTGASYSQLRYTVFDSAINRDEVKTITFKGSRDLAPLFAWDVSDERDGSVVAWVEGSSGSYDLYIAANGRIRAGSCSELFAFYSNVKEINFNGVLDTSGVKGMFRMFQGCSSLTSLDLSSFDTSCVTDMEAMFDSCNALTRLDVSSFDTSRVTNMVGMFRNCRSLRSLDLSSFDFSNVQYYGEFMDEGMTANGVRWENLFRKKTPSVEVGDIVTFGSYEQDNNRTNGAEAIRWIVLDVQDDRALLLSRYALDSVRYHSSYVDVSWRDCSLRSWLNDTFLYTAFSAEERRSIVTTYDTGASDSVFLLSVGEVFYYLSPAKERTCSLTNYAAAMGAAEKNGVAQWWWTRSPGDEAGQTTFINFEGNSYSAYVNNYSLAVRPAIWISLD